MTDEMMALRAMLEKGADADVLHEMIGFAAERLMVSGDTSNWALPSFVWITEACFAS